MANMIPNKHNEGHKDMEERVGGMATGVAEKASEAASKVGDRAQDIASSAMHKAKDVAGKAEDRADKALGSVGKGMESLAGTIREKAPHEGFLGTASSRVAETLDSGGRYLEEQGIGGLASDLTDVIRRNPIPAIFVGIACGFMLARAFRR